MLVAPIGRSRLLHRITVPAKSNVVRRCMCSSIACVHVYPLAHSTRPQDHKTSAACPLLSDIKADVL